MKKLLSALLIGVMSATAFAGYNVYDFKASVKRLNPVIKSYKYSTLAIDGKTNAKKLFDTYTVANDTIAGYLAIPECEKCTDEDDTNYWTEFNAEDNAAKLAVAHKLDFDKIDNLFCFDDVTVKAGLFNAGVGVNSYTIDDDTLTDCPTSYKKLKSAWVSLEFASTYASESDSIAYASDDAKVKLGFFGRDYQAGTFAAAGFGQANVQITTTTIPGTPGTAAGLCTPGTEPTPEVTTTYTCFALSNASGSIIGDFTIQAPCGTAIWDVCLVNNEGRTGSAIVEEGIVTGTWQMKFNKKVSAAFYAAEEEEGMGFFEFIADACGYDDDEVILADGDAQ